MSRSAPRRFGFGTVLVTNAYGLFLVVPVLLAMAVVSVHSFDALTFLLPLLTLAVATLFLPLGFGNPHVARLTRSQAPASAPGQDRFIVQVTLTPRTRSGLAALFEDADDFGWLSVSESGLDFDGDSLRLSIPFAQVREFSPRSMGWRGLFLYGPRLRLAVAGLPNVEWLTLAERSSWTLPGSRATTRRMLACLSKRLAAAEGGTKAKG